MPSTDPPAAPNRYADPLVFSDSVDAFLAWMATGFAEGEYLLKHVASPTVPAAGGVMIGGLTLADRTRPVMTFSDGRTMDFQTGLARGSVSIWKPIAGSANINVFGSAAAPGLTGTATAAFASAANRYGRIPKIEYLVTVAAINAVAGFRTFHTYVSIGASSAGEGGFYFHGVFGPATGVSVATSRCFFGLTASVAAPTDVEPSTLTDCIGVAWDAADARLQIMHNDAAGSCTKINLGASFTVPTVDRTSLYSLELYSPPGTTQSVSYTITDLISGATATGTITTNLPSDSTLLALRGYLSVGGTNSVVGLALSSLYLDPLI